MSHVSLITLGVDDINRSAAFYQSLGWDRAPLDTDEVAFMCGGTVVLSLYRRSNLAADSNVAAATASYASNVPAAESVDEVLARASSAGATITRPAFRTDWGGYVGYFSDPDGHLWEVAHNPSFPLGDEGQIFLPGFEEQAAAEAAENEARIAEFITGADGDDGATVRRLADTVAGEVGRAADAVAGAVRDHSNNVVLAAMLELGRRSRHIPAAERAYWVDSAASTLLSPLIRPDTGDADSLSASPST